MEQAAISATKAGMYMEGLTTFMWSRAEWRWRQDIWNTHEHTFLMEAGNSAAPL